MKRYFSPGRWMRVLLLGAMLAAMTYAVFGENGLMRLDELRRKRDEFRQENRRLEDRNNDLRRQVELLLHDNRYLERVAREELGLIGPNELVFRFSHVPAQAAAEKAGGEKKLLPRP